MAAVAVHDPDPEVSALAQGDGHPRQRAVRAGAGHDLHVVRFGRAQEPQRVDDVDEVVEHHEPGVVGEAHPVLGAPAAHR